MSAPLKEQLKNASQTTLNGAITNSATSITVTDGSVFPSAGNFRLIIDSEILLCSARSTNTLTVARGQEGTTAASHSDGATVTHIVTAASVQRVIQDYLPLVGSNQPALARIVNDSGDTILTASDFTAVNAGGSDVVSDQNGTILMRKAAQTGASVHALVRTAPSTPYAYIACFETVMSVTASLDRPNFGMVFRESGTGKLTTCELGSEQGTTQEPHLWRVTNRSGPTSAITAVASARLVFVCPRLWMRIEDTGTNVTYSVSTDGFNWILLYSASRTNHMAGGPNQIGWYSDNHDNTIEMLTRLVHWSKE